MSSPNERLRDARVRAGFLSAVAAAEALGVPASTYISHENGYRGFPARRTPQYAKKYKVTEEWLLYGKGSIDDRAAEKIDIPTVAQLEEMVRIALFEVRAGARLADYPPIVAASLHDQLTTILTYGGLQPNPGTAPARGKNARSAASTTATASAESRTPKNTAGNRSRKKLAATTRN